MIVNGIGQTRDSFESIYAKTEATGLSPLTFKGHRAPVQYEVSGNMTQEGTPTPTSPIYPQETGDRTENLFDKNTAIVYNAQIDNNTSSWRTLSSARSVRIPCDSNTQYTIHIQTKLTAFRVAYTSSSDIPDENNPVSVEVVYFGDDTSCTFTTSSDTKYVIFQGSRGGLETWFDELMLNEGSTTIPYEPYGLYKLPLGFNGSTQNLYLSEPIRKIENYADAAKSDNTAGRQIKKLVMTGEESGWTYVSGSRVYLDGDFGYALLDSGSYAICSHFTPLIPMPPTAAGVNSGMFAFRNNISQRMYFKSDATTSAEAWVEYLQQQRANGTPVTLWYILATPETETITSPTLTASAGQNTLSVNTTLAPSNIHVHGEYEIAEIYSGLDYANLIYLKTQTMTGSSPLAFESYPGGLRDYQIFGNLYQNGVSTPDNPVYPQETGEMSANLFYKTLSGMNIDANGRIISNEAFDLVVARATAGETYSVTGCSGIMAFYVNEPDLSSRSYNNTRESIVSPVTIPQDVNYVAYRVGNKPNNAMFNAGSTPIPYEPYGMYKLPIFCGGVTTNTYLGETQGTRNIKKLALTGEETISFGSPSYYVLEIAAPSNDRNNFICSHFGRGSYTGAVAQGNLRFAQGIGVYYDTVIFNYDNGTGGEANFKAYLSQQYAAGTPVTIWYVLATPETTTLNEPIRKIGDYADSVSGANLPTTAGSNTLSIGTTLPPSNVSITGHLKPSSLYGNLTDVNGVYIKDKDGIQIKVKG